MRQLQLNKDYLVIFGDMTETIDQDGTRHVHINKMTNCMRLPAGLLDIIPKQVVDHNSSPSPGFIVPERFEGLITR